MVRWQAYCACEEGTPPGRRRQMARRRVRAERRGGAPLTDCATEARVLLKAGHAAGGRGTAATTLCTAPASVLSTWQHDFKGCSMCTRRSC